MMPAEQKPIDVEHWGTLPSGGAARLFTLRNANGMRVKISDLGATLVSWHAPDRAGRFADVLLGHDTPADYLSASAFMGGTIGRWANRIADARFTLDGTTYSPDRNDGPNHLHGGSGGFHRALWTARETEGALVMTHESPDGEAGFPGTLKTTVRFTLADDGTLRIEYEAHSDAPTPVNLTNHAYFNLSGDAPDVRGHTIAIDADAFLEVNETMIPIARADVAGRAFDFRSAASIGERLEWPEWPDVQIERATGGFDHCYLLRDGFRTAAVVHEPASGRELTVATDRPGLQFYTGNFLEGVPGRAGTMYRKHAGLCLEAGGFPNQINMDDARGAVLRPGEVYRQTTTYRLAVR